ncbi:hypothetical protein TRIUR3_19018 [Triticum urartu]|uniref:Uncharacterized protein n=1 Tax=Triticum urartu TaxID=4572 RepID=M7ZCQ1_TRIUA|nr:hypothetical protein TRIUR3_19018 [Triticum urartu]
MGMAWSRQQGDAARAAAREHTRRCRERRRLMREAECFLRATAAGDPVSKLLEAGNAEYSGGASSFFGVLCCMSSSSSPSVSHDGVDGMHDRIGKRHSSTLQQLMVWEKKLYKEVKARERLQVRHDKKLAALRDQEYSRKINVDIQKLKGAWDRARAQLATASEAAHAGSEAISELRDTHLARQVLGLCHATRDMWKAMRQHHEAQCLIAQQLRGLSGRTSMDATTEIQHGATRALEAAMSAW